MIWCNGQWLDPADFHIAPSDRGLMHGLGLFETILAVDGRAIFLERHMARLINGCRRLGWPVMLDGIKEAIPGLIAANDCSQGGCRIRLSLTAGSGEIGNLTPGADHLILMTAERAGEPPTSTTANLCRFSRNEHSALAGLKCASYAENAVALHQAWELGYAETVFCNTAGNLCEAATSNLFLVKGDALFTPSLASGCLPGVTREVVIGLAKQLGIPCDQSKLPVSAIHEADEIFLTSSMKGVVGLSRFEQREFSAGPLTKRLRAAWNVEVSRECGS